MGISGCRRDPNVQKHKYLESGKRYEKEGKLREAAIQFSNALKVDHNFSDASFELGKTLVQMGNPRGGYQQLSRAVALNPSNIAARVELGSLLVGGGAPARASDQANAILALDPANADAYALLASVAQRKGDHAAALLNIDKALALDPNRSNFHVAVALIEGPGPTARQELRKAVSLDPKNTSAHLVFESTLARMGDFSGAEQQGLLAIQTDPGSIQPYLSLGSLYLHAGNSAGGTDYKAKAEATFRQATEQLSGTEEGAELLKNYYLSTGQLDRAAQVYSNLVSAQPKSVPLKIAYARILLQQGKDSQAASIVDELKKKNASNGQVALLNATLLLRQKNYNDAFTLLQKATRNSPENVQLQLMLAQLALAKGDRTAAEAAYNQAAHLEPGNLSAQAGLARIANDRHDYTQLAQIADKTMALQPNAAEPYLWRGTAEANQRQSGAEQDFRTAIQKNPDNAMAYLELGQLLLGSASDGKTPDGKSPESRAGAAKSTRAAEGRQMIEQALARDPSLLPALDLLAAFDLQAKDPAKAVARFEDATTRSPGNSALYTHLAILQLGLRDASSAQDNARKAMQLNPADPSAVQAYSEAQASLGNLDGAIATWRQWAGSHPAEAFPLTQLGMLESARGNNQQAMEDYKKALAIDSNQPLAANNLAYLMVENGQNVDVALSLAQNARRSLPNAPSAADTLAWVYYYKGTYASARDLLEDALKEDPNSASMHYHLGMVDTKLNDKAGAELHLKKAATLAPNSPTAKQASDALTRLS
jgi:tetratricopeptide (TPR) repeat protein